MNAAALSKPGTLVRARGREWVVLPQSKDELLLLRPLGGLDEEITGVLPAIELVESATFSLPAQDDLGDHNSGRLLRDAARLSTRAAAGPFRSFGRIAVEPRPYQLVPLMMALKLDPVRLLIADDVGIGKTVEAALVARELLDRGEIQRLAVLCPPHLAEQWQRELAEKFHIDAQLVLSSTIQRLERDLHLGESVFDRHPFTVVSMDFIKSPRRAADFIIKCPEFVIVDEAHSCTLSGGIGRGKQLRHDLLKKISEDPNRHLVLVTATPHSGNEGAFRSLLGLLDESFAGLPADFDKQDLERGRRQLARHLVQRRRADIRHFLETDTAFPERMDRETTYSFSGQYRKLFDDLLAFAREFVADEEGGRRRQRVRYWSALALLRCVSSSPAAAAATLRSRSAVDEADEELVDEVGRRSVLDQDASDDVVVLDLSPGSGTSGSSDASRRRMLEFARRAEAILPTEDHKLVGAIKELKALLKAGFRPLVFCRFIETAEYVGRQLREALPDRVGVQTVTGLLPLSEREARIEALVAESKQVVLVCTDCLSEGINLQEHFDSVLHYDLAWNPTRHEQREGRVDRFGQGSPEVRVLTYYGQDNPIDGVILDVLLRKHKSIKNDLGVAVAVPGSSEQIAEALFQGALFREETGSGHSQGVLKFIDDLDPTKDKLHEEWEKASEREVASRSRFAQNTLSPEDVALELEQVRSAIGRSADVRRFVEDSLHACSIPFSEKAGCFQVHISTETPRALRQAIGHDAPLKGRFELPLLNDEVYLGRTGPIIEGLASWVLDQALDPEARDGRSVAARAGAIRTSEVQERTVVLVSRFRFHLKTGGAGAETILVEEILPLAATGKAEELVWLEEERSEALLNAQPTSNLLPTAIHQQLDLLLPSLPMYQVALEAVAAQRGATQLAAHLRVREASRRGGRVSIEPVLPVDILGAYVLLPELS